MIRTTILRARLLIAVFVPALFAGSAATLAGQSLRAGSLRRDPRGRYGGLWPERCVGALSSSSAIPDMPFRVRTCCCSPFRSPPS